MNVDKDISRYWQLLQGQRQSLKMAGARRGQRPCDRKPKGQAYMQFMMALIAAEAKTQNEKKHLIVSSFVPPAYLPCTTPFAQLTPISIKDLRLETQHRGTYILLRAITPPSRMTGLLVLVEDEQGDVVLLQIYQQEAEDVREATDVVNVGTILLVREPYFKVTASGDYSLRVDHLSDIVRVYRNDSRTPKTWQPRISEVEDVELLKSRGDAAVGARNYWQAIREYSDAITHVAVSERNEVIKRNRALAYLKTKQFDAALSDTGFPSFGPAPAEKAMFRAAEALYFLERFEECQEVLEKLCAVFPNNQQASKVLDRARNRCLEQRTGDYDFALLQRQAKKLRPPQLDHATYVGPVEVRQAAGKGRGLFVTKAVKAGDLLLCEKAFSSAYTAEDGGSSSKTSVLMNVETDKGFLGGQADLITLIVQKLHRNPSLIPAFVTLHHGAYQPTNVSAIDGMPIVDTFLVERIMSLNVFGCPISSLNTHKTPYDNQRKDSTTHHSCGIWTQASYINHSCTSSARRAFIGNMMIVRATQDLEPGTEVTFWYQTPDGQDQENLQKKFSNWDFACNCVICQHEKKTKASVAAERRKLSKDLLGAFKKPHGKNFAAVERLLNALNDTYPRPAHEVPRILLWKPLLRMTRMYIAQNNIKKALQWVGKVLKSLGFIIAGCDATPVEFRVVKWGLVVDSLIEAFVHARNAFDALRLGSDAQRAETYARTVYKMVVGEDTSYEAMYGRGDVWKRR